MQSLKMFAAPHTWAKTNNFFPSFFLYCRLIPAQLWHWTQVTVIYRALKRRRLVNLFVTKIHFLQSILCTWMPTRTHTHTHKKQYAFAYKKRSSFCLEFAHFIVNFYIPRLICESNCAIWFRGNSKWNSFHILCISTVRLVFYVIITVANCFVTSL